MKKTITLLFASFYALLSYAQTNIPQLVSFSAVVRDADNQPLENTDVSIRLTFKEGGQEGPLVYCALHQTTTNQNGFMSLQLNREVLGTGCNGAPSTAFEEIPWINGDFWMEVEYQTTPNSPFVNLGQLELASSFYAFAAGTAESIAGFDLSDAEDGDVLTYNITTEQWEAMPASGGFSGDYNDLTNTPDLSAINTDNQELSVSETGDTLHLENGGYVIIPGLSVANGFLQAPTLSTIDANSITDTSATSGGNITDDGGAGVTQRGVVWSTNLTPTTADNLTNNGSGTGSFTSEISGLTAETTYYVRAYAINSEGTAYGNEVSFTTAEEEQDSILNPDLTYGSVTDQDGNEYATIVIGTQEWMAENLRTTTYANGDPIPNVTDNTQWSNLTTGAWAHYNNDSQYENSYGKLYNWYTVADPRNVCPTGWHVPTDAEYTLLTDYLGGEPVAGGKMKSTGTQYWLSPNTDATNESGFSGLPGGYRTNYGTFGSIGDVGYWWSSTEFDTSDAWFRNLFYNVGDVYRSINYKENGFSVRCIKD